MVHICNVMAAVTGRFAGLSLKITTRSVELKQDEKSLMVSNAGCSFGGCGVDEKRPLQSSPHFSLSLSGPPISPCASRNLLDWWGGVGLVWKATCFCEQGRRLSWRSLTADSSWRRISSSCCQAWCGRARAGSVAAATRDCGSARGEGQRRKRGGKYLL